MTVYVDDARIPFRRMLMCHMVSDRDVHELHSMAQTLGLNRNWFHRGHYNVCQSKRAEAIRCGAVAISKRRAAKIRSLPGSHSNFIPSPLSPNHPVKSPLSVFSTGGETR